MFAHAPGSYTHPRQANYLQAWVALFQLLFGFLLLPLQTLSVFGADGMPWASLPRAMIDGSKCLAGYNTVMVNGTAHADNCSNSWIPVTLYLAFNCLNNVLAVLVIKTSGASLLFAVSTLSLPITQVLFSLEWVNSPADPVSCWNLLSLALIIAGLVLYNRAWELPLRRFEAVSAPHFKLGAIAIPVISHQEPSTSPRLTTTLRGSDESSVGSL